ncbi:MAG TPA: transcriptional repressor LexA, partial [Candidatus Methanoperedens sp.]|nr:transcriptional repressor LexA [Candidatus Methanoperedens sp.]
MAKGLTKRQEEILDFIVGRVRDEGFPPTLKEIAERFGLASPNAARDHVLALERKGFLKRTGEKSRALSLNPSLRAAAAPAAPRGWPLVGVVPAGSPVLAEENFEGYVDLNELFGGGEGTFLLRVRGESMIGAGINDGDADLARDDPLLVAHDDDVAVVDAGADHALAAHPKQERPLTAAEELVEVDVP